MADTLGAIKAAFDLSKDLFEIRDASARARKFGEVQAQMLVAQENALAANEERAALVKTISGLEAEIVGMKDWEREKQRYQLQQLPPAVFVYALKQDMANGEPAHSICPTCYQRAKKSLLHGDAPYNGVHHLTCKECGTKLEVGIFVRPNTNRDRDGGSWMSR